MRILTIPLLAAFLPLAAAAAASRPNVIVIMSDDMGYSDLGCYGGEIPTPNLDALARNGLRFTQAYNTARCWPSRAAITTGYYAQQVRRDIVPGIASGGRGVRPVWAPLVSELLRPAGYRNHHSGKWHIDGRPRDLGFDHSFEIGQGQNNFFKAPGNTDDGVPGVQTPDYHVTAATAEHAVKYLRDHAARFPGRPVFLYLAFTAPHFPLHAPAADIARHRDTYHRGWNEIAAERWKCGDVEATAESKEESHEWILMLGNGAEAPVLIAGRWWKTVTLLDGSWYAKRAWICVDVAT